MIKFSNKGLLIIALVLSLLTTGLVYSYLKRTSGSVSANSVEVVIAKTDIGAKTKITADMLQITKVPALYLQPGGVQDVKDVIGVVAKESIAAGEQITRQRLLRDGKSAGFTGTIPQDKRAITIGVTEVTGVAGFAKAGDYVDVVVTFDKNAAGDNVSQLVLQNVLVLAANRETEGGGAETANSNGKDKKDISKTATVTLAVTPEEVGKLTLSEDKGKVRLVLRPFMQNTGDIAATPITPQDIVGVHDKQPAVQAPGKVPASPPTPKQTGGIQMIRGTKAEVISVN